ncbi:hypothetical protein [Flavobacterium sp. 3HN19-14]|uniref:hypothetical protein n=1 Tax=Flavobacterium sp. 3HN19-14 TaxID=3448133 RepID=UPI003EDEB1CA
MKKQLLIIISIFALSCSGDDNLPDATALNLITGINCRQNFDDAPLKIGNPNIFVNNKFVIFPNPATSNVYILSQENITNIWVVPSDPQKIYQDTDFNAILNSGLYTETSIIAKSDLSINAQPSDHINLDITGLEKGYYKVFIKIGGQVPGTTCSNMMTNRTMRRNLAKSRIFGIKKLLKDY